MLFLLFFAPYTLRAFALTIFKPTKSPRWACAEYTARRQPPCAGRYLLKTPILGPSPEGAEGATVEKKRFIRHTLGDETQKGVRDEPKKTISVDW